MNDETRLTGTDEERDLGEITPRSILAGLFACVIVSVWCPESAWVIGASRLNLSQLPVAAFGVFFVAMLLNLVVGRFSRKLMLTRAEIMVIFVMSFIASVMATADLLDWVFSVMAIPYYYATPENRWMDDVWPYLKQWAVVQGPSEELRWAYLGMPSGQSIPWSIWLLPSFWWGTFIGAVSLCSLTLAVIFRKQWADHERLAFPLAQVPLDIMSNPGGDWNIPELLRTRAFWIGVAIPLFIILWNLISYFEQSFPRMAIMDQVNIKLSEKFGGTLTIKLNWYTLGFAYMVNTNILFSVWIWHLLVTLESMIFTGVGYTLGPAGDYYSSRDVITSWQGFGAFIVFVLWGLWMARRHLLHVIRSVIHPEDADDEKELMPYRWAVIGLLASTLYIVAFLVQLGMSLPMVLVYLFGAFVAYFGTTRVIAQTGLVYMRSPLTPPLFVLGAFGTIGVSPQQLVGMVGTYSLVVNGRAPLMPALFHISYLGAKIGKRGRRMFLAAIIGLAVAYIVGTLYIIYISYIHGASTFHAAPYTTHGPQIYDAIIKKLQARTGVEPEKMMFLGIGAAVMSLLTMVQYRFPAFPLHPIGFPIAANHHVPMGFLPVFLAWLIKSLILHLGGVDAYQKSRPVFMGIIAGYSIGVMISFFVDWFWFPGAGHPIHGW
jgi:hypothetical protein